MAATTTSATTAQYTFCCLIAHWYGLIVPVCGRMHTEQPQPILYLLRKRFTWDSRAQRQPTGWTDDKDLPECEWEGVRCSGGAITHLDLTVFDRLLSGIAWPLYYSLS